jgi:hypothetical protein
MPPTGKIQCAPTPQCGSSATDGIYPSATTFRHHQRGYTKEQFMEVSMQMTKIEYYLIDPKTGEKITEDQEHIMTVIANALAFPHKTLREKNLSRRDGCAQPSIDAAE